MIQYIRNQLTYLDENGRAYSFNIKIHHLILSEDEHAAAYRILDDEKLNKELWDEVDVLFQDFTKETGLAVYTVGKRRGHLMMTNHGATGLKYYSDKELNAMSEAEIEKLYHVLIRFRKLYDDMFVIFRRLIAEQSKA